MSLMKSFIASLPIEPNYLAASHSFGIDEAQRRNLQLARWSKAGVEHLVGANGSRRAPFPEALLNARMPAASHAARSFCCVKFARTMP
jgi:hypothetical protein